MFVRECLCRNLVHIFYGTHCLNQIAVRCQIKVAAQTGKLQVEIDNRYLAVGDGESVCNVGGEKGRARATLAVDKDVQTAGFPYFFIYQLVGDLVDMCKKIAAFKR